MNKTSTKLNKVVLLKRISVTSLSFELNPSERVISNITKFASTYTVEKVTENHYVGSFLN